MADDQPGAPGRIDEQQTERERQSDTEEGQRQSEGARDEEHEMPNED